MGWVYGMGGPKQVPVTGQMEPEIGCSSHLGFGGSTAPKQTAPSLHHQLFINETEYLEVDQSSVVLTLFTAEVDVELSQKMLVELHRSVKKNPPHALKYELIYVCHALYKRPEMPNVLCRPGRMNMM